MNPPLPILLATSLALFIIGTVGAVSLALTDRNPPTATPALASSAEPSLRIDPCISVDVGQTFTIDIWSLNVSDLLAWEIYFSYDRQIIEVMERDVRVFLSSEAGSNVFDLSDPVPNTSGLYRMGAADLGGADSAETGSGILARLTLIAKETGVSAATIARLDFSGDGIADLGPVLTKLDGEHIGDVDGDLNGIFDGTIINGQIAVDADCVTPAPEPSPQVESSAPEETPAPESGAEPSSGESAEPDGEAEGSGSEEPTPADSQADGEEQTVAELAATPGGLATATAIAAVDQTPESDILVRGDTPSSGSGLSSWLIATIAVIAGLGLILSLVIIRSIRRPA